MQIVMKKKQFYKTITVILESGKNYDLTTLNDLISKYTDTQTNKCKICKTNSSVTTRKLTNHIRKETDFFSKNDTNAYRLNYIPTEIFT